MRVEEVVVDHGRALGFSWPGRGERGVNGVGPETAGVKDVVIRRACATDAADLARIQVDSWRETYRGMLPDHYLRALSYADHERLWRRTLAAPSATFVAVLDGRPVGLASGGRCRSFRGFSGELHLLYVLRAAQGRGIGRALFDAVHYALAVAGWPDMLVWVLAANRRARGFYEHLGLEPVGRATALVGGARVEEIAYGWRD
ncbi:MAG: GNAT family N-acetyltransferase [Geminicoccaceae bacterium]|nr:GNAT family N-acetyltransferase [Geminicoccaceae bacterium]